MFATCPTPGKLARLQGWLVENLPSAVTSPFRPASIKTIVAGGPGAGAGVGAVPTRDDLLEAIAKFEER